MNKKQIIRLGIFVISFGLVIFALGEFLRTPASTAKAYVYGFEMEPENSIDIVTIGASHMFTSFCPTLCYEEYGMTGYNLGCSSASALMYRSICSEALHFQNPQLIVVDITEMPEPTEDTEENVRKWIDSLPYGYVRSKTIIKDVAKKQWAEYFIPMIKYHSSWSDLEYIKNDCLGYVNERRNIAKIGYNRNKGFAISKVKNRIESQHKVCDFSEKGIENLHLFLEYCKGENLENVLFVGIPISYEFDFSASYYEAVDMIHEYGYNVIDYRSPENKLDISLENDFYNEGHLNVYGAAKFTRAFSDYILENYDIDVRHTDVVTSEWDDCITYNKEML